MKPVRLRGRITLALFVCAIYVSTVAQIQTTSVKRIISDPISGYHFQSAQEQQLQDDNFANPGLLWVDQGKAYFTDDDDSIACSSCHTATGDFATAASHYPRLHPDTGMLVNLEGQINHCRTQRQGFTALAYDSEPLLALTAYVANLAQGQKLSNQETAPNAQLTAGQNYYYQRRGQLNLACHHCHELNFGKMLRGDRLSQGHSNGYPAYKLEWQSLGSLYRRIRDCHVGVRAQPIEAGSQAHLNLELYLAWRAAGLEIETPAVRR